MPVLSAMHKERIERLKSMLRLIPVNNFDLSTICSLGEEARQELHQRELAAGDVVSLVTRSIVVERKVRKAHFLAEVLTQIKNNERSCGTIACVCGWLPVFMPDTFVYDYIDDRPSSVNCPRFVGSRKLAGPEGLIEWLGLPEDYKFMFYAGTHFYRGEVFDERDPEPADVLATLEHCVEEYEKL